MSDRVKLAWRELLDACADEKLPFMLHVFDGEHQTGVVAMPESKTVMLLNIEECDVDLAADLSGKVIIQLDAKMLLRLMPNLVRETHVALGLAEEPR